IRPAPALLPLTLRDRVAVRDREVYGSKEIFPSTWYSYRVGCGLNATGERVTHVTIHIFPVRYAPTLNKLYVAKRAEKITYDEPEKRLPASSAYDLVVIAPSTFCDELQRLVDHKNNYGVKTILKTTEEIYSEYPGVDKPEQIKYFIKDAIETWGIKYVLLVGGLNSLIWAKPRDNPNEGSEDWHVPVRYTNLYDNPKYPLAETIHDPGVISDLYYADIYKEGGIFEDWDPNNDGIFAAWNKPGVENDTNLDLYPDVAVGRLACRNIDEVKTVVDKIITYERGCDPSWFKRMTVISGDGFLDQEDLDIQWDTKGLPDGKYTIYAQSINDDGDEGPIDVIHVTLDRSQETKLTFNHDDHLNPALQNGYPAPPIAEIVSVSEGDILGNTDFHYTPGEGEAYLNTFNPWANISYEDGVLHIRGKSYDPQPYGNVTNIHVWVENENGQIVFSQWRNNTEMYYEGEWTTGEKSLLGRGGALYYMPEDFERDIRWASNGRFTGQDDVLEAFNEGSGFLFMSGHGSPNVWADHFPGVPGNRAHGSIVGLRVTTLRPWFPYVSFPVFPIDTLSNEEKLPIAVIGGCHNSQFNVSATPAFLHALHLLFEFFPDNYMWTYGQPVPECFSWRLVSRPNGGTIASIGNTGLGYGMPGKACTSGGGDAWITIEFFKQYGAENQHILGNAYAQTLISYINTFDMSDLEAGHAKTVQQWVLLGDPSLMIGGYSQ
ncbi:MAG: peptidase C25, partial [Thermoplasmata archaeon]